MSLLESYREQGYRSGELKSVAALSCTVLVGQFGAHASSHARYWEADALHSTCGAGRVDWMVAGFVRLNGAPVAVTLFASDRRALSFVGKVC